VWCVVLGLVHLLVAVSHNATSHCSCCCCCSLQEGLAHLLLAVADPGDALLLPDVAYPSYFGAGEQGVTHGEGGGVGEKGGDAGERGRAHWKGGGGGRKGRTLEQPPSRAIIPHGTPQWSR
jgi:hypothetical protein